MLAFFPDEHDDHETWTVHLARHEQNQSEQRLQRERGRFAVVSRLEVGVSKRWKKDSMEAGNMSFLQMGLVKLEI